MTKICHAHCPGGGHGGAFVAGLAIAGVLAYACLRAVAHTVETVLEVALIASAAAVGLALTGAVAFLVVRAHRRQGAARQLAAARAAQAIGGARGLLAIEAPQRRLAQEAAGWAAIEED